MNSKKTNNNKKNAIIAILAIIAIGLISLIIYNKLNKKDIKLIELDNLSYKENTFFNIYNSIYNYSTGIVELEGYAEVVNRKYPNTSEDNYVFFHIINSSSKEFRNFLNHIVEIDPMGYFARENAIGIGCLEDKEITMVRYGDKYYSEDEPSIFNISLEDSQKIISSTKEKPIKIIVRKDLDTSLINDMPQCTTLITSVEVVK